MSASELTLVVPRAAMDASADRRWLQRWLGEMLGVRVRLAPEHSAATPAESEHACVADEATTALLELAWKRLRRAEPGPGAEPVIDLAVADIARRLERERPDLAQIPRVPRPYRCALVLTHDVDAVDRWTGEHVAHLARHVRERVGFEGPRAILRLPWAAVRRAWERPGIAARIRACLELERRHGAHASYLFFSPDTQHRRALDGWYTPGTRVGNGDLASLWRVMLSDGFDVGLHLSIGAHDDRGAIAAEWDALRAFSPDLASCRSHYLKVVPDVTTGALASVGARVDLNLVATGYPYGTGAPFRYADSETYCLPTVIDDAEIPVDGAAPSVLDRVWRGWERVLSEARRHESVATVLLHPGKANAPAMLERLLRWGEANDAWMTSAAWFIDHWHRRAGDIEQGPEPARAEPVAGRRA